MDSGYSDIAPGTTVTVKNQSETIIGTGSLGAANSDTSRSTCSFPFTVSGLPDATFYVVTISHRGDQTYQRADLDAKTGTSPVSAAVRSTAKGIHMRSRLAPAAAREGATANSQSGAVRLAVASLPFGGPTSGRADQA